MVKLRKRTVRRIVRNGAITWRGVKYTSPRIPAFEGWQVKVTKFESDTGFDDITSLLVTVGGICFWIKREG